MVIPVTGLNGELSIIMGDCNMKRRWKDSIPLQFVVLCQNKTKDELVQTASQVRQGLQEQGYTLSIGIACQEVLYDVENVVTEAEEQMRQDKMAFYDDSNDRRMR